MGACLYRLALVSLWAAAVGCTSHHVTIDPVVVEIKPMKIDINLKIDKELKDYFKDVDDEAKKAVGKDAEAEKPDKS